MGAYSRLVPSMRTAPVATTTSPDWTSVRMPPRRCPPGGKWSRPAGPAPPWQWRRRDRRYRWSRRSPAGPAGRRSRCSTPGWSAGEPGCQSGPRWRRSGPGRRENAVAAQRRVPGQVEVERGVPCGWIHKIAPPGFFVQMVCPYFLINYTVLWGDWQPDCAGFPLCPGRNAWYNVKYYVAFGGSPYVRDFTCARLL